MASLRRAGVPKGGVTPDREDEVERRLVRSSVGLTSCWWWARQVSWAMEQYLRRRPEGEPVLRGGGLRLR